MCVVERRQGSLTQADTAIVGRDRLIRPDLETRLSELFFEVFEQHLVLENTARADHGV